MKCPKCKETLHCPCVNCADMNEGKSLWIWEHGELIKCPKCGFTDHCDNWPDGPDDEVKK